MPRPRTHDLDVVFDAAESIAVAAGVSAVTIRAVAAATGVSNGALYHAFGSRAELLARTRVRAARRFLAVQAELVAAAGPADPVAAVVAAAEASIVVAQRFPESGRLLLTVSRTEMLSGELPEAVAAEVAAVERELLDLLIDLALRMWGRRDGRAVDVVTLCVVDLPTAILLQRNRLHSPAAQRQLRAAVRAVLDVGPAQQSKENP